MYRFSGNRENSNCFDFNGSYKEDSEKKELMKIFLLDYVQNEIIDFDDHFEDANQDWKNTFLDKYFN